MLDQRFNPRTESVGVELLVQAGRTGTPHVEIEHTSQLIGRRKRDQFGARLQSAVLNDAMKDFRLEPRHDVLEMRCRQDAIDQSTRIVSTCRRKGRTRAPALTRATDMFGHGPAMIQGLRCNKQS